VRRKDEITGLPGRSVDGDRRSVAPESLRASDGEEWSWMIDEDPAFYLTKPGGVETAGA
jgi:hypothetical protein